MAYNQSFRLAREVTKIQAKKDNKKFNPDFRAVSDGTTVTIDFGPGTPRIELTINGEHIDAKFVVTPS